MVSPDSERCEEEILREMEARGNYLQSEEPERWEGKDQPRDEEQRRHAHPGVAVEPPENIDRRKLCAVFVGRIQRGTTADDLRNAFINANLPFALCEVSQKHGSSPVTFGFVYYYSLEDARTAVQTLHGYNNWIVKLKESPEERNERERRLSGMRDRERAPEHYRYGGDSKRWRQPVDAQVHRDGSKRQRDSPRTSGDNGSSYGHREDAPHEEMADVDGSGGSPPHFGGRTGDYVRENDGRYSEMVDEAWEGNRHDGGFSAERLHQPAGDSTCGGGGGGGASWVMAIRRDDSHRPSSRASTDRRVHPYRGADYKGREASGRTQHAEHQYADRRHRRDLRAERAVHHGGSFHKNNHEGGEDRQWAKKPADTFHYRQSRAHDSENSPRRRGPTDTHDQDEADREPAHEQGIRTTNARAQKDTNDVGVRPSPAVHEAGTGPVEVGEPEYLRQGFQSQDEFAQYQSMKAWTVPKPNETPAEESRRLQLEKVTAMMDKERMERIQDQIRERVEREMMERIGYTIPGSANAVLSGNQGEKRGEGKSADRKDAWAGGRTDVDAAKREHSDEGTKTPSLAGTKTPSVAGAKTPSVAGTKTPSVTGTKTPSVAADAPVRAEKRKKEPAQSKAANMGKIVDLRAVINKAKGGKETKNVVSVTHSEKKALVKGLPNASSQGEKQKVQRKQAKKDAPNTGGTSISTNNKHKGKKSKGGSPNGKGGAKGRVVFIK